MRLRLLRNHYLLYLNRLSPIVNKKVEFSRNQSILPQIKLQYPSPNIRQQVMPNGEETLANMATKFVLNVEVYDLSVASMNQNVSSDERSNDRRISK